MSITTTYDPEADVLFVQFSQSRGVARSTIVRPGVHVEFDADGRLISLEVLDASRVVDLDSLRNLMDGTEWMSLNEAAEAAGLSATTLRVQLHNGRITGEKRGRDWVIARHVLDTYLDEVEQRAAGERSTRAPDPPTNAIFPAARRSSWSTVSTQSQPSSQVRERAGAQHETSSVKVAKGTGQAVTSSRKPAAAGPKSSGAAILTRAATNRRKKGK